MATYKIALNAELVLTEEEELSMSTVSSGAERVMELIQSDRCSVLGLTATKLAAPGEDAPVEIFMRLPKPVPMSRFYVDTPDGPMFVYAWGEEEFPGVRVDLKGAGYRGSDLSLSLTEYIPGGEGISDYIPANPGEMARQRAEVPVERKFTKNGHEAVTAGFVTRGWPNELEDEELHHRIFHYGYKRPKED